MKLPTWEQSAEAVQNNTATQLEAFIYEYQPKGYPYAWRWMLSAAITQDDNMSDTVYLVGNPYAVPPLHAESTQNDTEDCDSFRGNQSVQCEDFTGIPSAWWPDVMLADDVIQSIILISATEFESGSMVISWESLRDVFHTGIRFTHDGGLTHWVPTKANFDNYVRRPYQAFLVE